MGNNGNYNDSLGQKLQQVQSSQHGYHYQQKQQQPHYSPNGRQRVGLMPSDGQDSYKRPATRNSRRSRAERTSYLVATGHLNLDETEHLNGRPDDGQVPNNTELIGLPKEYQDTTIGSTISENSRSSNNSTNHKFVSSRPMTSYEQSLLEDYHNLSFSPIQQQFEHFQEEKLLKPTRQTIKSNNNSRRYKKQLNRSIESNYSNNDSNNNHNNNKGYNRGKFTQTTYTEVPMPMKTSPAFEYILKDNRRKKKRCCLWFLYLFLMITCVIILVFSITHLIIRYQNQR